MAGKTIKEKMDNEDINVEDSIIVEADTIENVIIEIEPDTSIVLEEINKSMDEISNAIEKKSRSVKFSKKTFEASDKIPCKSLFFGKLTYTSPTNGARYIWNDYGTITLLPFSELETMSNFKPNYLQKPLILINDADVVEEFNLASKYEQVADVSKLEALFNSGNLEHIRTKIREAIDVNQRDTVISKVRKMRLENKLVDINIINLLKEELKFDIG